MTANKAEVEAILSKKEVQQKLFNSFNEFLRRQDNLLNQGLVFEKKVTKFSKTSAAIYLPKRLIGKTFRVELTPIDDGYEISEPTEKTDKLVKEAEKDLQKIQDEDSKRIDINETKPNFAPIL